jgi:hypothetical protein
MKNIWQIFRELHLEQCRLSIALHLADIERARIGLQRSFDALHRAQAALDQHNLHDFAEQSPNTPPLYLTKR